MVSACISDKYLILNSMHQVLLTPYILKVQYMYPIFFNINGGTGYLVTARIEISEPKKITSEWPVY